MFYCFVPHIAIDEQLSQPSYYKNFKSVISFMSAREHHPGYHSGNFVKMAP